MSPGTPHPPEDCIECASGRGHPKFPDSERLTRVEAYVVHHTQTRSNAAVETIRAAHVARGWGDVAYHYLGRLGEVWPGRDPGRRGTHAPGWNGRSIAVALVGDHRDTPPPERQLQALVDLLNRLAARWGRWPVYGHREAMIRLFVELGPDAYRKVTGSAKPPERYTDCPGPWMPSFRERLGWGRLP